MAKVTQDNEVFVTVGDTEILAGSVEKRKEHGDFFGSCSRGDATFAGKKGGVVESLEDHFIRYHTTSAG